MRGPTTKNKQHNLSCPLLYPNKAKSSRVKDINRVNLDFNFSNIYADILFVPPSDTKM